MLYHHTRTTLATNVLLASALVRLVAPVCARPAAGLVGCAIIGTGAGAAAAGARLPPGT
ncbi:MAG: hypothetical protein U1E57_02580 [Paenacidovorax caeni]